MKSSDDKERNTMKPIPVPRPKKHAHNPDRLANALLLAQVQHLRDAEKNLPLRYRSEIYINTIRTEAEAAEYIREVTEAIHRAHDDAKGQRAKRISRRKAGLAIVAAAERPARKRSSKAGKKSSPGKSGRKKK
jgi:hypothetical protein